MLLLTSTTSADCVRTNGISIHFVHAYDHYVDIITNTNGDQVTLPYGILRKQMCAIQPYADHWFKSIELALLILHL